MVLEDKQIEKLNEISREFRPKILNDENIIYSDDALDFFKLFNQSYKFLKLLFNKSRDLDTKREIMLILKRTENLFNISLELLFEESGNALGRIRSENLMQKYIKENRDKMSEVIDFVYPLGKKVNIFDPDVHGGIIED